MNAFNVRGLEFHSSRMWQWSHVERALDLMQKLGLNALIFHQNDLTDQLVLPKKYFSEDLMWKRWPVRMHTIYQNRHYINKVVREARERGISFYPEVKELYFPDDLPEIIADLRNEEGGFCPNHPFWWEFLTEKYRELLSVVPDIAGIIVSPGSRESKVSASANSCSCSRCEEKTSLDWYTDLLCAMHLPLSEKKKTLAVRDFSYTAKEQSMILNAASRCSPDVVITLKNTPHDYFPTFPDNPRIGDCGNHRQWVEFDAWGQFYGIGFFPVGIAEDIQGRMRRCKEKGADGVFIRTDWEVITEASCFNSFNLLNLIAGGVLSRDPETDLSGVYEKWLSHGLYSPLKSGSVHQEPVAVKDLETRKMLESLMKASWKIMEKAVYVRGHLFHEDDQYPNTVRRAFQMLVEINGRDEWEPGASARLDPTPENLAAIYAEKSAAVKEVKDLAKTFGEASGRLPRDFAREIETVFELYQLYVEGFEACAKGCFSAKRLEGISHTAGERVEAAGDVIRAADGLRAFRVKIMDRLRGTRYPHYVYWLLDEDRLSQLAADLDRIAAGGKLKNENI